MTSKQRQVKQNFQEDSMVSLLTSIIMINSSFPIPEKTTLLHVLVLIISPSWGYGIKSGGGEVLMH